MLTTKNLPAPAPEINMSATPANRLATSAGHSPASTAHAASAGSHAEGGALAIKAEVRELNFYYRNLHALKNLNLKFVEKPGHRDYWPVGMRQEHAIAVLQPNATTCTPATATRAKSDCSQRQKYYRP